MPQPSSFCLLFLPDVCSALFCVSAADGGDALISISRDAADGIEINLFGALLAPNVTGAFSPTGYDGTGDTVTVVHPWGLAIDSAGTLYASTGPYVPGGAFVNSGVRIRMIQRILR